MQAAVRVLRTCAYPAAILVAAAAVLAAPAARALDLDRLPEPPVGIPAYAHEIIVIDAALPGSSERPVRVYLPLAEPEPFALPVRAYGFESDGYGLELSALADVPRALAFAAQLERPQPGPGVDHIPNPWFLFGGLGVALAAGLRLQRLQKLSRRRGVRRRRRTRIRRTTGASAVPT